MASPPRSSFYGDIGSVSAVTAATDSTTEPSHSSSQPSTIIIWIVSLTLVFFVSFCLLRYFHRRFCLRRHLSRSSTSTIAAASNRVRHEEESSPTDSSLDSLPLFTFSSIVSRSAKDDSMVSADCSVCLSKFEPQDQLRLLPLCCHAFHAHCIDTWLKSNQSQTCPLCRSPLFASDSDLMKALVLSSNETAAIGRETSGSFRLELGSVNRRHPSSDSADHQRRTYSVGSFDYIVDVESEVTTNQTLHRNVSNKEEVGARPEPTSEASLAAEVAAERSWLKEYVDRLSYSLSSRSSSFRSSGRLFTGSSRWSENSDVTGEYDVEANRIGEEISEMFRWFSGV